MFSFMMVVWLVPFADSKTSWYSMGFWGVDLFLFQLWTKLWQSFGSSLEKLKWIFAYQLRGALDMRACATCNPRCFYTVELYSINSHNRILKDHVKGFKTLWILSLERIFKMSEYPQEMGEIVPLSILWGTRWKFEGMSTVRFKASQKDIQDLKS